MTVLETDAAGVPSLLQTTPLIAGLAIGAAAYAGRAAVTVFTSWKSAPRMRQFYRGGFLSDMNRREAAQILGALGQSSSFTFVVPAGYNMHGRTARRMCRAWLPGQAAVALLAH